MAVTAAGVADGAGVDVVELVLAEVLELSDGRLKETEKKNKGMKIVVQFQKKRVGNGDLLYRTQQIAQTTHLSYAAEQLH